jgi:hypothetical protein
MADTQTPLSPPLTDPQAAHEWFAHLYDQVTAVKVRYKLPVRTGWWADALHYETLAAFVNWVERYDSGEWDDPPGKLALLYDLERVSAMLRDGNDPFDPTAHRGAFDEFLAAIVAEASQ